MNAINVIAPYKHLGMWVFDDPRVGLSKEPFVSGADAMIDRVVADIPNADSGFRLIHPSVPQSGALWGRGACRAAKSQTQVATQMHRALVGSHQGSKGRT
jgi:hypothetical protein